MIRNSRVTRVWNELEFHQTYVSSSKISGTKNTKRANVFEILSRYKKANVRKGSSRKGNITIKREPTQDSPQETIKDERKTTESSARNNIPWL
jgi:hypothetical protein